MPRDLKPVPAGTAFWQSPRLRAALLIVLLGLSGWRLVQTSWHERLVTNVADLLPEGTAAEAEVSAALRDYQARLVFFAGRDVPMSPTQREALMRRLEAIPGVGEAGSGLGQPGSNVLGAAIHARRIELLFPAWLVQALEDHAAEKVSEAFPQWLAERAAAELDAFLDKPDSIAFAALIEEDPLLLLPGALRSIHAGTAASAERGTGVIWALLDGDPLSSAFQDAVLPHLASAVATVETPRAAGDIVWFGAIRFAAETRQAMQREVAFLNAFTLLLVGGLAALFLRRPWQLVHLLIPVTAGLAGGLAILTLCYTEIHVLALVMGSILAGVAIDYGVHLFFHSSPGGTDRTVVKALVISGLSTVVGYVVWSASSLVLARQTGIFVAGGLASALLAVLLYPPLRRPATPRFEGWLRRELIPWKRPVRWGILVALAGVALLSWSRLRWNDSLGMLDVPHPELERAVEIVTGQDGSPASGLLVFAGGRDWVEAADRLSQLEASGLRADRLIPTSQALAAVADFAPGWPSFRQAWHRALEERGFDPSYFQAFEEALERRLKGDWRSGVNESAEVLGGHFRGPSSVLFGDRQERPWLAAWHELEASEPLPPGISRLAIRDELEALIGRWRNEQIRLSLAGAGAISLILFFLFPLRSWPVVGGIPLGSVVLALGLLGGLGGGLNLFHLAGALLAFGVTLDYAVFHDTCSRAGEPFPTSIRFSALTTTGAFSVLMLSEVAGVQALGATVALSVLMAILGLELVRPAPTNRPHA